MAPTYATLALDYFESKLHSEAETRFSSEDKKEFMRNCKIYLDDCFTIWNKSEDDLRKLHNMLSKSPQERQVQSKYVTMSCHFPMH